MRGQILLLHTLPCRPHISPFLYLFNIYGMHLHFPHESTQKHTYINTPYLFIYFKLIRRRLLITQDYRTRKQDMPRPRLFARHFYRHSKPIRIFSLSLLFLASSY